MPFSVVAPSGRVVASDPLTHQKRKFIPLRKKQNTHQKILCSRTLLPSSIGQLCYDCRGESSSQCGDAQQCLCCAGIICNWHRHRSCAPTSWRTEGCTLSPLNKTQNIELRPAHGMHAMLQQQQQGFLVDDKKRRARLEGLVVTRYVTSHTQP